MAGQSAQTQQLVEARELLKDGMPEKAIAILNDYLLSAPADTDALKLFAKVVEEAGREDAAQRLSALANKIDEAVAQGSLPFSDRSIAAQLFEAGFAFSDLRLFELAAKILAQAVELAPEEPVIRYELAFALMSRHHYLEAIPHFHLAGKELNDFDTNLNLSVCLMMTRNFKEARQSLDNLAQYAEAEDERKELAHRKIVLNRVEELGNRQKLNARDWLYGLYGSFLLRPEPISTQTADDARTVARTLLVLKGVIEGLRMDFEAIEFYNPLSKPLARLLAELMELPLDRYRGPDRPDRSLLVIAQAVDLIGPHQAFIETSDRRSLFAYSLPQQDPLPVVPDITGCLMDSCPLPWHEETTDAEIEEIVRAVLEKARHHEGEPEILKEIQESVEYCHLRREWLLFGNSEKFPQRPEYTAEIPTSQ